ncbi:hypothetical protein KIL84_004303, partial [Mauremys mutica]
MLWGRSHTVSYKYMKCKRPCSSSFLPEVWEAGGVWGEREEKQASFRQKVVTWVWVHSGFQSSQQEMEVTASLCAQRTSIILHRKQSNSTFSPSR